MTSSQAGESAVERLVAGLMLAVFWSAFASLAVGLAVWVWNRGSERGALLLAGGLIGLMLLPTFRLLAAIAAAYRQRDWLLLASALSVLAILAALTFRDAVSFR